MKNLKRSYAALLAVACFGAANAAPTLPQVVAGQASFSQQGNVFSITNTPNTIINWQGFSVNPGEVTRFIQQGADSAVLNRIVGQDPSRIMGALQSNGKVFLINPNGILFGRDSRVDVNGLVASTLNISNADFVAGKKNFAAGQAAGSVRNDGAITTPNGGQVFLIAAGVENNGVITSPKGDVVLAAGYSVQLVDSRDPDLHVVVSAPASQAVNLGQVIAQGGKIGIYGALVNQRGLVNANSASVGENGKIVLKASRDTLLEQGSVTSATGPGTGGEIHLLGERVGLTGNARVDASGALGGGSVLLGGGYQGKNPLLRNAQQAWLGKDASIRADALDNGDGGMVVLWSDGATGAYGSVSARGAGAGNGGLVETSGHYLDVAGLAVNAGAVSGKAGKWLLDPYDLEVAVTPSGTGTEVSSISPETLRANNTDIVLEAEHNLTILDALETSHSITAQAGHDILVNAPVTTTGGNLDLRAAHGIVIGAAGTLLGTQHIDLEADGIRFDGKVGSSGTDKPIVSLTSFSPGLAIEVRTGAPDSYSSLWLDAAALSTQIAAAEINIGSSDHTGTLAINAPITQSANMVFDNANRIDINAPIRLTAASSSFAASTYGAASNAIVVSAGGAVSAGQSVLLRSGPVIVNGSVAAPEVTLHAAGISGGGTVTGDVLTLRSSAGIGTGTLALRTQAHRLIAYNDGEGNLPINIHNQGDLTLEYAVQDGSGNGGAITIDNAGTLLVPSSGEEETVSDFGQGVVSTRGGSIKLTSQNRMTINGQVSTGSGSIRMDAGRNGAFIASSGAHIASASGDVTVVAGSTEIAPGVISVSDPSRLHLPGTAPPPAPAPTLEACIATPSRAGCAAILGGAIQACVANPDAPHCGEVMPSVASCKLSPGAPGCSAVLQRDALAQCIANPKAAGCDKILPTYDTCAANPSAPGCDPVIKARRELEACVADPKGPGCAAVLPPLATCRADGGVFGCAPVLARAEFETCLANPAGAGCTTVLPTLASCKASGAAEGCPQVLRLAFNFCLVHPTDASCNGILPTLSQCVADKSQAGCGVVLPTLAQCIGSPTLQGCSVMLPPLAQCAATPALEGCSAVLPNPSFCGAHPLDPTCQVFNPTPGGGQDGQGAPVAQAVKTSVNLINTSTAGKASSGTGGGGAGSDNSGPAKPGDKKSGPAPSENSGAKNEKPATKTYCN
ncbi:MAG: filamentous hemagglutinin N-terminal domain-containing protein [Massilia sp.]